jgi:hypothetical protein
MVKRRNVIFGVAAVLIIVAIIVVIILDLMGYFKKKSAVGSSTNTDFRPNAKLAK